MRSNYGSQLKPGLKQMFKCQRPDNRLHMSYDLWLGRDPLRKFEALIKQMYLRSKLTGAPRQALRLKIYLVKMKAKKFRNRYALRRAALDNLQKIETQIVNEL